MRAVKTVISAAGNLKRENPEMSEVIGAIFIFSLSYITNFNRNWVITRNGFNQAQSAIQYFLSSLLHGIQGWLRHFFERPKNKRVSYF